MTKFFEREQFNTSRLKDSLQECLTLCSKAFMMDNYIADLIEVNSCR